MLNPCDDNSQLNSPQKILENHGRFGEVFSSDRLLQPPFSKVNLFLHFVISQNLLEIKIDALRILRLSRSSRRWDNKVKHLNIWDDNETSTKIVLIPFENRQGNRFDKILFNLKGDGFLYAA